MAKAEICNICGKRPRRDDDHGNCAECYAMGPKVYALESRTKDKIIGAVEDLIASLDSCHIFKIDRIRWFVGEVAEIIREHMKERYALWNSIGVTVGDYDWRALRNKEIDKAQRKAAV